MSATPPLQFEHVGVTFGERVALDDVTTTLLRDQVYGLFGRNGAGKTTLMSVASAGLEPSSGRVLAFGTSPFENPSATGRICFVRDNQVYPEASTGAVVLEAASWFFAGWDHQLAQDLVRRFRLPLHVRAKKLSRGQRSALAIVIGLSSRAPLTFLDEPYLGMDAPARELMYQCLLADLAAHPRTVIISSHLVDEVSHLVDRVLLLASGRLILDCPTDELLDSALALSGPSALVEDFARGMRIIGRSSLGGHERVVGIGPMSVKRRQEAHGAGVRLESVGLQELTVALGGDPE